MIVVLVFLSSFSAYVIVKCLDDFYKQKKFNSVNSVVNRQGDVKPELHLLMPIFSTRSQFESHKIEEIGQHCQLKWRLKTVKVFDHPTLDIAFQGYNQRDNCGIRLNKHSRNGIQNNETYHRSYQYVGYYILETM